MFAGSNCRLHKSLGRHPPWKLAGMLSIKGYLAHQGCAMPLVRCNRRATAGAAQSLSV